MKPLTFLFIPYFYFVKTRLRSNIQRVSWFFVYFLPTFFLFFYLSDFVFSLNNILLYFVSSLLINYIYENGYIQNDVVLTQKEDKPTLRLSPEVMEWSRRNVFYIFLTRFGIAALMLIFVYFLQGHGFSFYLYLVACLSLQIIYFIYNSVRSLLNLFLILPLSYLRFFGFVLPLVTDKIAIEFIAASLLIYPISKTLEFTKSKKYNLKFFPKLINDIDFFRVKYYLTVSVILFLFSFFCSWSYIYLIICVYFFVFRLFAYFLLSKSETIKKVVLIRSQKGYKQNSK